MNMGVPLSGAVTVAKQAFEMALASVGRDVQLKRRLTVVPNTPDDRVSAAFGERNPFTDTDYTQYSADPNAYDEAEDLKLLTELNRQQSAQEMVNLTEGQVMAYLSLDAGVKAGDLIIMDGDTWLCIGARTAMVNVYATAALKKIGPEIPAEEEEE